MGHRLRIALLDLAIRLSRWGCKEPTIGCCACRGPFRHLWLEDGEAVCDDHLVPAEDAGERIEFLTPFEPMTERRFFLLLDAADEGWLPPGAVLAERTAEQTTQAEQAPAAEMLVRVAVEVRQPAGDWRRERTVTAPVISPYYYGGALHQEACIVMDGQPITWVAGEDEDPFTPAGWPVRALVLPLDPAKGDTAAEALHIWGGAVALEGAR